MRKKIVLLGMMLLPAVGCSGMNNTEKGLLGGGAVGAGIGALATRGSPAGALVEDYSGFGRENKFRARATTATINDGGCCRSGQPA